MRIFRGTEAALHWREDGDPQGMPVVFANSLGTDLRLWDGIIDLLPPDLRLIRFDKRGHGLSSRPPGPYSIGDLAGDTAELLDHINAGPCLFVGLSIGGMIAQALAASRPDLVRAAVFSNTAAKIGTPEMWQDRINAVQTGGIEALADGVMDRWFSPEFLETDELILWRNMLTGTPPAGYAACCAAVASADQAESTSRLRLPVLGIAGTLDLATPPELVAETTALVTGSKFTEIPGVGHLPCVEAPEQYADIISDFIEEVRP